jgi:hypothetical protein
VFSSEGSIQFLSFSAIKIILFWSIDFIGTALIRTIILGEESKALSGYISLLQTANVKK